MALGFTILGMMTGLVAGIAALILGAGVGMAFLAYVAGGMAGMGLGLGLAFRPVAAPHRAARDLSAAHSH